MDSTSQSSNTRGTNIPRPTLLTLPTEIRMQIYELVFQIRQSDFILTATFSRPKGDPARIIEDDYNTDTSHLPILARKRISFLLTCRQTYHEARPLALKSLTVILRLDRLKVDLSAPDDYEWSQLQAHFSASRGQVSPSDARNLVVLDKSYRLFFAVAERALMGDRWFKKMVGSLRLVHVQHLTLESPGTVRWDRDLMSHKAVLEMALLLPALRTVAVVLTDAELEGDASYARQYRSDISSAIRMIAEVWNREAFSLSSSEFIPSIDEETLAEEHVLGRVRIVEHVKPFEDEPFAPLCLGIEERSFDSGGTLAKGEGHAGEVKHIKLYMGSFDEFDLFMGKLIAKSYLPCSNSEQYKIKIN